jgi:hypothetical protein
VRLCSCPRRQLGRQNLTDTLFWFDSPLTPFPSSNLTSARLGVSRWQLSAIDSTGIFQYYDLADACAAQRLGPRDYPALADLASLTITFPPVRDQSAALYKACGAVWLLPPPAKGHLLSAESLMSPTPP